MVRNISNSILVIFIMVAITGCKVRKNTVPAESGATTEAAPVNKLKKLEEIKSSMATYSTLSLRAKADLVIDNSSNDATMSIRISHSKAIWISVTAIAGLEVARVLITPDSVKILNRLESTYTQKPFKFLYEYANKEINFNMIENILAGNPFQETLTENSEINMDVKQSTITGMLGSLAYNMVFNEKNKLTQTSLKDNKASQSLIVGYGNFIEVQNQIFPHTVNLKSQADRKNVVIDLKYSRVGINETLEMPFNVPKRFTVNN
ncbi:MAG: DUF4292 domain-containing protein [Flavobacterium sp.]|nr:DUF4292 domain-containing protein [Pedobacter sp.]